MKWPVVRLGDEVIIKGGGTPSRLRADFYQGDIPWATIKDLTGLYLEHTQEHITKEALESSAANLIPAGNVILATRVGLGKVAINTVNVAINQDLKALFCSPRLSPKYLVYYLASLSDSIEKQGVGATVKGVTLQQVENWPLPLPTLSEQRRIVEILDQADALRKKRAQADTKAECILPALFIKMFGDPAANPKGWDTYKVADVAVVRRGDFRHRPRTEPRFYGGPYPFIQINDITSSNIVIRKYTQTLNEDGLAISRMFLAGTVVLSIAATIAASGILGFDSCFPDSLVGVQGKQGKTTQEFLLFFFRSVAPRLAAQAPQLAQKNINLRILNELDIPVPPIEKQGAFSQMVSRMIAVLEEHGTTRSKLDVLWNVLLNRAFSGDLTAKWREAHMKELLAETEEQAKYLTASGVNDRWKKVELQESFL